MRSHFSSYPANTHTHIQANSTDRITPAVDSRLSWIMKSQLGGMHCPCDEAGSSQTAPHGRPTAELYTTAYGIECG